MSENKDKNMNKSQSQSIISHILFWGVVIIIAYTFFQLNESSESSREKLLSPIIHTGNKTNELQQETSDLQVITHSKGALSNQRTVISVPWSAIVSTSRVNDVKIGPSGKLWAATEDGLISIFNDSVVYFKQSLGNFPAPQAECLAFGNKKLWIGTLFGLFSINSSGILKHEDIDNQLSNNTIWSLDFGNQLLWIGTQNGLSFMSKEHKFTDVNPQNTNNGLRNAWCQKVKRYNEWVVVSHDNGISIWNTSFPASNPRIWRNIDAIKAEIPRPITDIAFDGAYLWFSTNKGIFKLTTTFSELFSGHNPNFTRYTDVHGLPSNRVNSIIAMKDSLWLGTDSGLARIHEDEISKIQPSNGPSSPKIRAMSASGDILWIGTDKGLYYMNTAMVD